MARVAGDNAHGFKNEQNIVNSLNEKTYKELNLNMKNFVDYIASCDGIDVTVETVIGAHIEKNNKKKQDLYINLLDKEYAVSVKMGKGNSTHQEKCEDFIDYIVEKFDASEELCDDIRIMTWCDGTIDGSGKVSDRMSKKEYLLRYKDGIGRIREFIHKHEKDLIKRVLFVGKHESKVDFIYHGTELDGKWISADELVEYQMNNLQSLGSALAKVGRMNLQVWNRSLTGNSDKKRGQIQIKYSGMEEDLNLLMHSSGEKRGTFEGDQEEFNISKIMNRNKNSTLWSVIGHKNDNEKLYAVKAVYNAYSKIANKKVKPKTDAYIVSAEIDHRFLLEKEYILTEADIEEFDYATIENTGISIKMKESKSFTYEKLSYNSFVNLFDSYVDNARMLFCGLVLYQGEKNIMLNKKIVVDLGFSEQEVVDEMRKTTRIEAPSILKKEDVKIFRDNSEYSIYSVYNFKLYLASRSMTIIYFSCISKNIT